MKSEYIKILEVLEKENYRLKCYYNTCIKLLDYKVNKYDIICGKKIYIYGCGDIGKRYYKIIREWVNVVAFIDQSANNNEYRYDDSKVISLNDIDINIDFDYIIITLEDLYQRISDDLIKKGISIGKIKSIDEMIS